MTNWPNTIQRLGSDDIMSLGIKSSAFMSAEHPFGLKFEMVYVAAKEHKYFCRKKNMAPFFQQKIGLRLEW